MPSDLWNDQSASTEAKQQELLGRRLREAREYLGLSQEFVAERLNVPRASISAMETGKRKVSSLELKQLARLYKQSIHFFLGEDHFDGSDHDQDETFRALFRTTRALSTEDREQVLRFARFLRSAGNAPRPVDDTRA